MEVLAVNCQPVVMVEPSGGCYEDGGALPYVMQSATRKYPTTNKLYFQTEDVICNPENPVNPDSELVTGDFPKKHPCSLVFDGNYARSSQLFESGFTGFSGFMITSPV